MVQPSTENIQPPVVQTRVPIDEPVVNPKHKPTIPYPLQANKQKLCEKNDILALKFVEIFRELHFERSFMDALLHMPKFASMFKSLLNNKENLFDLLKTPGMVECSALADLGASINLMPLSFHYPADFVVVDYDADPRVPLILGRPFLRTARALIDVYCKEITLRFNDETITFKYAQEVLGFLDISKSGNPTPSLDPILSNSFPSLTPFEGGDFILEEIEACLMNDSIPPGINDADFDAEGDLLLLEKLLNDDPSSPLPPKELYFEEIKTIKSSIDDPPELDLRFTYHLERRIFRRNG
ncbi:reverse transcriptase domain-containing protein [Tanacetum coccineum]|uniref:Reverse transcriptase domain-containing protein n=1 Tax=Tanacetum coccineum TaxID=301880 RepID=A0ABQ5C0B2_9ASTR